MGTRAAEYAVDVDGFRSMMRDAGAEDAVDSTLATFVIDAPRRSVALAEAIASGNPHEIRQAAHAYKSSACTVRAHALATVLLKIELDAYDGRVYDARARIEEARRESDAALTQLHDYLAVDG